MQNIHPQRPDRPGKLVFSRYARLHDPQLTAELAYMGSTLLNKARKESQPAETPH